MVVVRGARIARIRSADEFMESCENFGSLEAGHVEEPTPDVCGGEATGREACNNAEVVGAAFEGTPEVRIM